MLDSASSLGKMPRKPFPKEIRGEKAKVDELSFRSHFEQTDSIAKISVCRKSVRNKVKPPYDSDSSLEVFSLCEDQTKVRVSFFTWTSYHQTHFGAEVCDKYER